ncbi:MAG: hypothetical protein ACRD8O_03180 [Bryobacteraceae bacterium]
MTPIEKNEGAASGTAKGAMYVVCLDCGKKIGYDWDHMRTGKRVDSANEAANLTPETLAPAPKKKTKRRVALWASAVSAAWVTGKAIRSRKRSTSPAERHDTGPRS